MSQKKIITNYLYNLSYQILQILLPIITTPYISRILGVEGVGTYSVTYAVTNYFILFGMVGLSTYGSRQIAFSRDDKRSKSQTFWDINTLKSITMGIAILAFYCFTLFDSDENERMLYLVQGIVLIAQLFDVSWYYAGVEKFKKTAVRNMIVKLTSVVCIFLFVKKPSDLVLYAFIISVSTFLGQAVLWLDLKNEIIILKPDFHAVMAHLKGTIPLWIPSIAINIYNSVDKVMLSRMVNNSSVGLYESSQKLVKVAATITTSLSTVVAPNIANNFKNGREDTTRNICTKSLIYISMISIPICFGMIGIRNTIVPWFYGAGFEEAAGLLGLSSWLIITLGWSSIFGTQILVSCKEEKKYTAAILVGLLINLFLNTLLIPSLHERGALIASVAAEYSGMLIMLFFCRKWVDIGNVFSPLLKYFFSGAVMCGIVDNLDEFLAANIIGTMIQVVVGVVVYLLLLLAMRESYLISLILKVAKSKKVKNKCSEKG